MLEGQGLNTRKMNKNIYIQLLGEGTKVYRPVQAILLEKNIYKILNHNYDPEDEEWEFVPDTKVLVEKKELEGKLVLVAVKKIYK